ncbi:MAG: hypothetical protein Ct9H300mP14_12280 [Gammaproteobacteria bacterium]|nr:MAG: hypothetical protein Ct9H300mP14_12280 [Gammaproteobacteria bacterium]
MPTCIFQRGAFFALGLLTLVAALHNQVGAGVQFTLYWGVLCRPGYTHAVVMSGCKTYPRSGPECGPGLDTCFVFPLSRAIRKRCPGR